MKEKIKKSDYLYQGLTLFLAIGASIILYFLLLRLGSIVGYIAKFFKILAPIFLGLLFAYLINPLVKFFESSITKNFFNNPKGYEKTIRGLAIAITYFIVGFVIFLFIMFVVPNLLDSIQVMFKNIPNYINVVTTYLKEMFKDSPELYNSIDSTNTNIVDSLTNIMIPSMDTIMLNITTGITGFVKGVINVIIGLIVSVYLIYDKESFLNGTNKILKALLPKNVYETSMTTLSYTDKIFGGFMIAKIIDSLIIGVLTFIILSILQIPYTLVISVIVCVTNIIPYFGPFIGAIPSAFLLLLINPTKCLTFIIAIFLIQQFDGNILGPRLIGNKTGIKSFWVLFSILLFGGIFGFFGMIFGVPVFAVIYSVLASLLDKKLAKVKSK